MTNTINNVPRELLAELQEHIDCHRDAVLWGKMCDLLSAPSPAGVDAGLVAVEWAKDAEEWGPALNEAGWLFISELNEDPQKSALIFNNTKGPLRAAIMKYAEIVASHRAKGVV